MIACEEIQRVVGKPLWHLLYDDAADLVGYIQAIEGPETLEAKRAALISAALADYGVVLAEASTLVDDVVLHLPADGRTKYLQFAIREDEGVVEVRAYHVSRMTLRSVVMTYVSSVALPYWYAGGEAAQLRKIVWW